MFFKKKFYPHRAYVQGFIPRMPEVRPLPDGKNWLLVEDFSYTDEHGATSTARATKDNPFKFDFASIPRFAWRIVGPPATGKYRYAAIIHDFDCRQRTQSWQVVHRRFLSGMKYCQVAWWKRWIMFVMVWSFGPRW